MKTKKGCGEWFWIDGVRWKCGITRLCENCKPKNHNEYVREWNKKNPDKVRKIVKEYRSKNQEKQPAWDKARRGIGAIKIEGLCQICKVEKAELRHHEDYSKPREVILICVKCHKNIHANSQQDKSKGNFDFRIPAGTNAGPKASAVDFNLSEKRIEQIGFGKDTDNFQYEEEDIKEFIKRLKEVFGKKLNDTETIRQFTIATDGNYKKLLNYLKPLMIKEIDKLSGDLK